MAKDRLLTIYLFFFGILNVFFLSFAVPIFFDALMWQPRNIPVEMMMSGIYFSMGVIMVSIASDPLKHKGFIDFIILANFIHAAIMVIFAENAWHLVADALGIMLMALIPLCIYPWGLKQFLRYS
jgi:predicted MFS family arabinose efflux permease